MSYSENKENIRVSESINGLNSALIKFKDTIKYNHDYTAQLVKKVSEYHDRVVELENTFDQYRNHTAQLEAKLARAYDKIERLACDLAYKRMEVNNLRSTLANSQRATCGGITLDGYNCTRTHWLDSNGRCRDHKL